MIHQTSKEVQEFLTGTVLQFHWWMPVRAFDSDSLATASKALEADQQRITARFQIIDTKHPAWRALTTIKGQIRSHWEYETLPYVLAGQRLCPRANMPSLMESLDKMRQEVGELVRNLDDARWELMQDARERLKGLFKADDFPGSWKGEFWFELREVAIEPPTYLLHSNSDEYKRQLERNLQDIGASLAKFESQAWSQLSELAERLQGMLAVEEQGGKPRIIEANVTGFQKLFDRTAKLNFAGTAVFQTAMAQAKEILSGVTAEDLRRSQGLRQEVRDQVGQLVCKFQQLGKKTQEVTSQEEEPALAG